MNGNTITGNTRRDSRKGWFLTQKNPRPVLFLYEYEAKGETLQPNFSEGVKGSPRRIRRWILDRAVFVEGGIETR